ncbi:MAG TPA: MarR family transcriptional regulator [Firmicutes bacterium]|nr:MarR family transcriptional regulator [Bacillota bacterium]
MKSSTIFVLTVFNQAHKKMNVLYHNYAKSIGLSDSAFWLLYSLYEHGAPCTQKNLCEAWFYPPQTINTALKFLEGKGLISLAFVSGNKKNKRILFTKDGEELVQKKIAPLVRAEERSFERLNEDERENLLALTQKHIGLLEEELNQIIE